MPKPKRNGYYWRHYIQSGTQAAIRARQELQRLMATTEGTGELNRSIARLALDISQIQEAFMHLDKIDSNSSGE